MTISPYLNEHRPGHQTLTEGIPVNPNQRSDFDKTDNHERDPLETSD